MNEISKLLESLAVVAWPLIVVLLILLFRPAVAALIESAKSRKFTLKIGGQELSMEEASQQQRNLIADLQAQVVEIKKRIEAPVVEAPASTARLEEHNRLNAALWVDDRPKNNSYFVQRLRDKGVTVDLALSTEEGLRLLAGKKYGVIISDMGRTENGVYRSTAGLELLKQVRTESKKLPFVIFCSSRGVREYRNEARKYGATAVTSSPTEMFGILETAFGETA
jgi:CheY-like chemotaxis protein